MTLNECLVVTSVNLIPRSSEWYLQSPTSGTSVIKTEREEKSSGYRTVGCMWLEGFKKGDFQACEIESVLQIKI